MKRIIGPNEDKNWPNEVNEEKVLMTDSMRNRYNKPNEEIVLKIKVQRGTDIYNQLNEELVLIVGPTRNWYL